MHLIIAALLSIVALCAIVFLADHLRRRPGSAVMANATNPRAVTTHPGAITRTLDAAVSTKFLLAKQGNSALDADICGAADVPIGVFDDTGGLGDRAAIKLLGSAPTTLLMVASEAISAGELVFAAASGKVQDLPAGAGTYHCVGTALTASVSSGDIIEVDPCTARAVVVG